MAEQHSEHESDGWREYQRLVLAELKRFNAWLNDIDNRLNQITTRLAVQEVKAGFFGAIGGAATILVLIFLKWLFTGSVR
jgi:hypothetical protein